MCSSDRCISPPSPCTPNESLPGLSFRIGDEFRDRFDAQRGPHDQQHWLIDRDRNRPEVADRIVVEFLRKVLGHRDRRRCGEQQRVAVWQRLCRHRGPDPLTGAGLVLDDETLTEVLLHRLRRDSRRRIQASASADRHDHPDGPVRKGCGVLGLRRGGAKAQRQRQQHQVWEYSWTAHDVLRKCMNGIDLVTLLWR